MYLQTGHPRWQHKSHVVSVDHGKDTNCPSCYSPGVLESQLLLPWLLGVLKDDLKHPGEVLTQMVGCSTLQKMKNQM